MYQLVLLRFDKFFPVAIIQPYLDQDFKLPPENLLKRLSHIVFRGRSPLGRRNILIKCFHLNLSFAQYVSVAELDVVVRQLNQSLKVVVLALVQF